MNPLLKRTKQTNVFDFFSKLPKMSKEGHREESYTVIMNTLDKKDKLTEETVPEKNMPSGSVVIEDEDTEFHDSEELFNNSEELFSNSEELFSNSEELFNNSEDFKVYCDEWFASASSMSEEASAIKETLKCTEKKVLPQLKASDDHSIMFRPHLMDGIAPRPFPDIYRDKWDENHVRMPCSPFSRCPVQSLTGTSIENRWDVICNSLGGGIKSSFDLENAIMQYNIQYVGKWDFRGLHGFINHHLDASQKHSLFNSILPGMVDLALQLPFVCTRSIPLLKKRRDHVLSLSQKQIACLLANAFFCTFPRRNFSNRFRSQVSEYSSFPNINFNRLFIGTKNGSARRNCEKLKCLINYFRRVIAKEPTGTVSFHRRHIQKFPDWSASEKMLREAVISTSGFIESEGEGMLQVDFANKFIGGGVLGSGCVQEEIRFIICPELIVSRLFTESLEDSESVIITGAEQYSKYKGYADTFQYEGDFIDCTPRDSWGRKQIQVVAIDALCFKRPSEQFQRLLLKREVNKAYVGFLDPSETTENLNAVATGNWGCGVFRGSPYLKFLIQMIAASQCNRSVLYFTFGNEKLQEDLSCMQRFIIEQKLIVGDMWCLIEMYSRCFMQSPKEQRPSLFDFIYSTYTSLDSEDLPALT